MVEGKNKEEELFSSQEDYNVLDENSTLEQIKKGSLFKSKQELQRCFEKLAIMNEFEYLTPRSWTKGIWMECKAEGCKWKMHAYQEKNSQRYRVSKYHNIHKHSINYSSAVQKHATAKKISELLKEKMLNSEAKYTTKHVIDEMQVTFGLTIGYRKAFRALRIMTNGDRGTEEENYQLLPSYLEMLKRTNPESYTNIRTNEENRYILMIHCDDYESPSHYLSLYCSKSLVRSIWRWIWVLTEHILNMWAAIW